MRVLHLLAPAPVGGLESAVLALSSAQAMDALDVHVVPVVERSADHPFVASLHRLGLPSHPIEVTGRSYAKERRAFDHLLATLRPTVVHTHGYRPDVVDAPLARRRAIPTVSTVHGFTRNGLRNRFYEWLQQWALRRMDAVVAVSDPLGIELVALGVPPERVHVVRNAWVADTPPLPRLRAREILGIDGAAGPVVGWVGRISPEKGPDIVVQALAEPILGETRMCMVGDGGWTERIRTLATRLGIADRILWPGRIEQAARVMSAFDVLVLPSRTEGTPMVLFEATSAGVPVVAAAVGGVPAVLGDGPNVVPPEDPKRLSEALAALLSSSADRAAAVGRARQAIERDFGLADWVARHRTLYDGLAQVTGPDRVSRGEGVTA